MSDILNNQIDSLGISDFLEASKKYTVESFPDLDIGNLFSNSLTGNISNVFPIQEIENIFLKEIIPI